jgi:hypothetical protein
VASRRAANCLPVRSLATGGDYQEYPVCEREALPCGHDLFPVRAIRADYRTGDAGM